MDAGGYRTQSVLEGAVHLGRADDLVGRSDGGVPRYDRAARSGHLGARDLSGGAGGPSGRRCELVRSRRVRGVRGQEPAHGVPLVQRGGTRQLFRHSGRQHLQRQRLRAGRSIPGSGAVRNVRHGGERQGVVLDRVRRPPVHPGRRMERAELHVHRPRRAGAARPAADLRLQVRQIRHGAAAGFTQCHQSTGARLHTGKAGWRRSVRGHPPDVCLRSTAAQGSGRRRRGRRSVAQGNRVVRRWLRQRADTGVPVPAEERGAAVPDGDPFPVRRGQTGAVEPSALAPIPRLHRFAAAAPSCIQSTSAHTNDTPRWKAAPTPNGI